jgi:CRP-like cAMP-binding protein
LVLNGKFLIHRSDGTAIAKVQRGEILGEMSFVEDELPNVDVTSLEDSSVVVIDYEFISERFREVPTFECRFYKAISHFLSARLRFLTVKPASLENGKLVLDQLDANIDKATLDRLNIAGERFNRLLKHFA